MAKLLDRIVGGWLEQKEADEDEAEQRRLHAAAAKAIGAVHGDDPYLAEQASQRVKEILRKRHGR